MEKVQGKFIAIGFDMKSHEVALPVMFVVQLVTMSKFGCDIEIDIQGGAGDSEKVRMLLEFRSELKGIWECIVARNILPAELAVPWEKI